VAAAYYVASAFARQIAWIERGLLPPVIEVGNLEVERDFLDVRDIVAAHVAAVAQHADLESGRALNLASGRPTLVRSLLDILLGLSDASVEVVVDPQRLRPDEPKVISGNPRRAAELLGWHPTFRLETTLADVLQYWRGRAAGS
jgi:GDP-4-dehydro-6-deoxy-D-mannose reductase